MYNCPHCKEEFEVESVDQIRVYNANARTLSIKCTGCNKNFRLNKVGSEKLFEKFPDLESEIEKTKAARVTKEIEDESSPLGDFEEKLRDALSIFGLDSLKYKAKITAICKLIERTGASREWLRYHMQRLSFSNQKTIESIVDLVFLDESDSAPIPPYPSNTQGRSSGYAMQQLPGGQVILIPQGQQPQMQSGIQPIIIDRGGDRSDRVVRESNDDGTIIEELDDDGKVKKRIIKGGSRLAAPVEKNEDLTLRLLTTLKDIGLIQPPQQRTESQSARIPEEIHQTLEQLKEAMVVMSSSLRDRPAKSENEDIKKMSETVNKLTDQIQYYEKEKRDNETKALKDGLSQVKEMIAGIQDRRSGDAPAAGLSDVQFGTHTQHKNLETVTDSVTHMGDRITHPLNEILKQQQKMNSLLLVRDIEKQDGVPAGTYMKVLMPSAAPGEGEVQATVKKWQDKAASVPGGK